MLQATAKPNWDLWSHSCLVGISNVMQSRKGRTPTSREKKKQFSLGRQIPNDGNDRFGTPSVISVLTNLGEASHTGGKMYELISSRQM